MFRSYRDRGSNDNVFRTFEMFFKGHLLTIFKQLVAQNTDCNILLNCFVLLLVQATLNDTGNNRGGGFSKKRMLA